MDGLDQDRVLPRPEVLDHVDHFHAEALGLGALEDGEPVALHARFDLIYRECVGSEGRAPRLGGFDLGRQRGEEATQEGGDDAGSPAHLLSVTSGRRSPTASSTKDTVLTPAARACLQSVESRLDAACRTAAARRATEVSAYGHWAAGWRLTHRHRERKSTPRAAICSP